MDHNYPIYIFKGVYALMDPLYERDLWIGNIKYRCVESAYQSFRFTNIEVRKKFIDISGLQARKLAFELSRKEELLDNWDECRFDIMCRINMWKFSESIMGSKLKATNNSTIIYTSDDGDLYFGSYHGRGENKLGEILMWIRARLTPVYN